MSSKKASKPKARKAVKKPVSFSNEVLAVAEEKAAPVAEPAKVIVFPSYEHAQVLQILGEQGDFYHCKMSDGTTKHVPKHLFN